MYATDSRAIQSSNLSAVLYDFVNSRPGFDPANYNTAASYRADQRRAAKDKRIALLLLDYISTGAHIYGSFANPLDYLADACRDAFSGRLSWDGNTLDYCTGQYYPTEYRRAAVEVCKLAIYRAWRADDAEMTYEKARQRAKNKWGASVARYLFA